MKLNSKKSSTKREKKTDLGMELQLPGLRRGGLKRGDGVVGVHIEDSDEAIEGGGGGDDAGGMGGHGDHAEAVAGVGPFQHHVVSSGAASAPEAHGLVERAGQKERVGTRLSRRNPCRRPN
uniref:Uncharacterized protein n=1 Tax=Opuntia streptacantha TaxID=393608 RepID=A0A7C9CBJ2_OPUST